MVLASLARRILRDNVPELATALAGQFSDHHASSCPKQAIQRAAILVAPHDEQAEYPAGQHVDDLEQHPGQPTITASSLSATVQINHPIEYSSGT